MAKDNLYQYDSTAANNLDVGGISVAEGMLPSGVNNAIRELMSHQKDFVTGAYLAGIENVALGNQALDDGSLSGSYNTAIGHNSLSANTTGARNTAVGRASMVSNTTGGNGVAVGFSALESNTSGNSNIAIGREALASNTTASENTAVGYQAGYANTTGTENVAVGAYAYDDATTGSYNTAIGRNSLSGAVTGNYNTAVGRTALRDNTSGGQNTAIGVSALESNTTASYETAVGYQAGYSTNTGSGLSFNTFIGAQAGYYVTTGTKNTIIGGYTGNEGGLDIRTSSNNIVLSDGDGNPRLYINSDGSTFTRSTSGTGSNVFKSAYSAGTTYNLIQAQHSASTILNGTQCFFMTTNGNMYNTNNSYNGFSDIKLKENIVDSTSQWDDIKALQVRKYNMIGDTEVQLGVIAQEVEAAGMNGLVTTRADIDDDGNDLGTTTKSVKYSVLYMKAVKALQEAMDRIETLEAKVQALETN